MERGWKFLMIVLGVWVCCVCATIAILLMFLAGKVMGLIP